MKEITELNEIKKIELDILDYVTEICDNNEIKYFLGGGTLLGAIRELVRLEIRESKYQLENILHLQIVMIFILKDLLKQFLNV